MSSIYESRVDPLRPNDAHGISLQLVGKGKTVLELGAAAGHVTKALKSLGNTVTAIERDGRFLGELTAIADDAFVTDLDWLDLRDILRGRKYDMILAGDVLEHCSRPDLVLLQCHDLLAPGGSVVVSLPNIAHADVRLSLLAGRFEYRTVGLLDNTHLRFFTRDTIIKFANSNGFEVAEIYGSTAPIGGTEFGPPDSSIPREAIEYVQSDRDHTVYQYVMRLVPSGSKPQVEIPLPAERSVDKLLAELAQTQEALGFLRSTDAYTSEQVRALNEQLASARDELALLNHDLVQQRETIDSSSKEVADLAYKLLQARDHAIGTSAELGVIRARHARAQEQVDSLVNQLNILHTSRTWRIGRFVLLPLRAVRWLITALKG